MHKLSALAFPALLLATATAAAADDNPIDTVVVTATRTAQQQILTGNSISIITADQLDAGQNSRR